MADLGQRPGDRPVVGVVGGGQLARMLHQAAIDLDVATSYLVESPGAPVARVAPTVTVGDCRDLVTMRAFARSCDVVTFEHEKIDEHLLRRLEEEGFVIRPTGASLGRLVDKVGQRELAAGAGVPSPPFDVVRTSSEAEAAVRRWGFPVVFKAARGGYDGRGVHVLTSASQVPELIGDGRRWLVEPALPIQRELATQVVRSATGQTVVYPVVETIQVGGICRTVIAGGPADAELDAQVESYARALAEQAELVGVMAVELFVVGGRLLVNEVAPRVHNSGHYTIEACTTSQFENHLRAVLGLRLGSPGLRVPCAVMENVIASGDQIGSIDALQVGSNASIHLYGKRPWKGRKVGHVTVCGSNLSTMRADAERVAAALVRGRHPDVVPRDPNFAREGASQ